MTTAEYKGYSFCLCACNINMKLAIKVEKRSGVKMLIEIESVYGDKIICGRYLNIDEVENAMKEILEIVNEKDFTPVFCSRFQYEVIPYSNDIRVDYRIDLDTHLLF